MENKDLNEYIFHLVQLQNQLKVYHWQTKIFSKHKALCEVYDFLAGQIDEIAEIAMGKYGRVDADGINHSYKNISDAALNEDIENCIEHCVNLTSSLDSKKDTDLLNLRDEVLGNLNKLKYLLTLK